MQQETIDNVLKKIDRASEKPSTSLQLADDNRYIPEHELYAAGVPKRYRKAMESELTLWDSKLNDIRGKLKTGFLIALIGPRGTGKTAMACEVIKEGILQKRAALYAKAMDFFIDLKGSYRKDSNENERAVIEKYTKPGVLVIDEIQERGETDWENREFTYLLDKRYDLERDTILIGNFTPDKLAANVGASVASRMQQTGGIIECNWASFREKA